MSAIGELGSVIVPAAAPARSARTADPQLEMFCREYRGLHALILRRVRDPEIAEDILQDAVLTTLLKLRSGQIDRPENAGGYIFRVALNHLRNYRRKDRSGLSSAQDLEQIEDPAAEAAVASDDGGRWSQAVAKTLSELPTARDREILVRFYLDDEDKDSICRSLRLTEAHFHRVIFRARLRFRELIERKGYHKEDLLSLAVLTSCLLCGSRELSADLTAPLLGAAAGAAVAAEGGSAAGIVQ